MSSALGLNLSSPPPAAPLAAAAANENEEDEEEIRGEINAAQGKELLFCLSYPRPNISVIKNGYVFQEMDNRSEREKCNATVL